MEASSGFEGLDGLLQTDRTGKGGGMGALVHRVNSVRSHPDFIL
jgi:hypothetical protein